MHAKSVVADIMTRDPIALQEEDDVWVLQEEMQNLGLHHVPVLDGKRLVGLVGYRDLVRHHIGAAHRDSLHDALDEKDKRGVFVASIMAREVATVRPDTTLADAARKLSKAEHTCLPVVEADGTLVGIVTERDFVRLAVQLLEAGS